MIRTVILFIVHAKSREKGRKSMHTANLSTLKNIKNKFFYMLTIYNICIKTYGKYVVCNLDLCLV